MKKINITKKQYDESKYFTKKYGALKYVSESGKLYKTDKGVVLALEGKECQGGDCTKDKKNESIDDLKAKLRKSKEVSEDGETFGSGEENSGSEEVTRGELTDMLKDVVDTVEKVCDAQDCSFEEVLGIEPEGEAEDADSEEVIATKDEVAEVLQDVIEKVEDVAEKAGIELPEDDKEDKKDGDDDGDKENADECNATECGDKQKALESVKKAHRARLVKEAIARRARAKKIHESVVRKARLRKIRESVARRARLRKIHESIAKKRIARKAK